MIFDNLGCFLLITNLESDCFTCYLDFVICCQFLQHVNSSDCLSSNYICRFSFSFSWFCNTSFSQVANSLTWNLAIPYLTVACLDYLLNWSDQFENVFYILLSVLRSGRVLVWQCIPYMPMSCDI